MQSRDFLEALLPPEGVIVLGVLPVKPGEKTKLFHKFHTSLDSLVADAEQEQKKGRDVYIAPASFKDSSNRTASNAQWVKSFFLDLDVGEGDRKYPSKRAAAMALAKFVADTGMPVPSTVDSGGGVHAYWVLEEAVSIGEWFPIAVRLKRLCREFEFLIDPTVTADAARIMRMVGGLNFKRDAAPVTVKTFGGYTTLKEIAAVIDNHLPALNWLETAKQDWMKSSALGQQKDLDPNIANSFKTIAIKSLKTETGCAQIKHCIVNQETLSEPMWRAALSVAWYCEDGSEYIHKLSHRHPDYDYDVTVAKAMGTKGPYRCDRFLEENPRGCAGCPHQGKIASPIVLGRIPKQTIAVQGVYRTEVPNDKPEDGSIERLNDPTPLEIPEYPEPYFRPMTGGLAVRLPPAEDGREGMALITDQDFWVSAIISESDGSTRMWMKSYSSTQGLRDFVLPLCINQGLELTKHLETYGLIFDKKSEAQIRQYMYSAVKNLSKNTKNLTAVNQFGYDKSLTSFVIGDRRYKLDGATEYCPPSRYTLPLISMYTPRGDLQKWKNVVNRLCIKDTRLMPHLTFVLAAFASPLMRFTGRAGLTVSMWGDKSGTNKTLAQLCQLSVFGNPKESGSNLRDSRKSILERLGTLGNLTCALDEATTLTAEQLQIWTYDITEGRPGNQANQHGGGEKISDRHWSLLVSMSSNQSLKGKLMSGELGGSPEANLMRIMEFEVTPSDRFRSLDLIDMERVVSTNYGVAGEVYLKYIMQNLDKVRAEVAALYDEIAVLPGISAQHRFYVAGYAAMLYAAAIVKDLGILDVPIEYWSNWMVKEIRGNSKQAEVIAEERDSVLGEFMRSNANLIMRVRTNSENKPIIEDADKIRGPVVMRYEVDENRLYIVAKEFRNFCADKGYSYHKVVDDLYTDGSLRTRETVAKRLMAGVFAGDAAPVVRCLELYLDKDPTA